MNSFDRVFGEFIGASFINNGIILGSPEVLLKSVLIDESSIIIKYQVNRVLNYRININPLGTVGVI